jgi:hypothetical protein
MKKGDGGDEVAAAAKWVPHLHGTTPPAKLDQLLEDFRPEAHREGREPGARP